MGRVRVASAGKRQGRVSKREFVALFDAWKGMVFTRSREVAKKDDPEKFFLKRAPH
jgi:hypothetical protein